MDIGLSWYLDIYVGLSSRVQVSISNGGVVVASIDTTISNWGSSISSSNRGSSISSSNGGSSVSSSKGMSSISNSSSSISISSISSSSNDSGVSHGQAGKNGNEGLHCDL